jgi:hypothetical protein
MSGASGSALNETVEAETRGTPANNNSRNLQAGNTNPDNQAGNANNDVNAGAEDRKNAIIKELTQISETKREDENGIIRTLITHVAKPSALTLLNGVFGKHANNKNTFDNQTIRSTVLSKVRLNTTNHSRLDVLEAMITVMKNSPNATVNNGNNKSAKTLNQAILAAVEGLTIPPSAN